MVLHTKSRQEKAVARFLFAAGLPFYLPLLDRVNIVRGRKVVSQVPLFPGYAAISTKRVCRILEIADQESFLDELRQIDDALSRGAAVYHCPFAVIGTRCRVVSGPFEGIEGVVCSRLGHNRLALQIQTLGQGAVLEIDADLLELV
ncbi:MAG: transcription termination/antitermination protein NusG [Planctomycetota bacterium]|jgi:transcription antitermination factor NusG